MSAAEKIEPGRLYLFPCIGKKVLVVQRPDDNGLPVHVETYHDRKDLEVVAEGVIEEHWLEAGKISVRVTSGPMHGRLIPGLRTWAVQSYVSEADFKKNGKYVAVGNEGWIWP